MASETTNAKTGLFTADIVSGMYDPYRMQGDESLVDFYARLKGERKGGILGTGGLMDQVKPEEVSDIDPTTKPQELGRVKYNGGSLSAAQKGQYDPFEIPTLTEEERYNQSRWWLDNPEAATLAKAVLPFGLGHIGMMEAENFVRNNQNEASKKRGLWQTISGQDGDIVSR